MVQRLVGFRLVAFVGILRENVLQVWAGVKFHGRYVISQYHILFQTCRIYCYCGFNWSTLFVILSLVFSA